MAQQNINFGTFPDDPNSDAIRIAFTKVQENFTELYNFQRDLGVLSINRTPQPGITINSPTGNVLITANISQVTLQSTSLGLGLNIPLENSIAVLESTNQSIFIDLKADTTIANSLTVGSSPNVKIENGNVNAVNIIASNLTGTITTADQPNITSLGTLANLTVSGVSNLGSNSNVKISGGTIGQVLSTDGAGNLSWITAINTTVENVVYVSKSGNDSNDGRNLENAKLTIAAAVTVANDLQTANPTGTTVILVKAGDYTENNPMSLSAGVSIVGDNLRTVSVRPANPTQDIFWVRNRCYLTGMTFRDHLDPAAAVAFPKVIFTGSISGTTLTVTAMSTSVNDIRVGTFVTGAGVATDTVITALGTGTGGTGTYTVNNTQTVSSTTLTGAVFVFTSPYVQNCSSITTTGAGMRVDGDLAGGLKSMVLDAYTQFNQGGLGIHIINQGYAQLVSIFSICCTAGVKCEAGGTCSITNSNNSFGDYGLWADGVSNVLYSGTLISNTRSTLTIGDLSERPAPNDAVEITDGVNTQYILIRSATPLVGNVSVVTFAETLEFVPAPGPVDFRQISLITASGQTFEYVGTGTNLVTATPRLGGIPIQENEIRETDGGRVNFTSTDQFGDFRIGGGLTINEEAGVIEGTTFDKSLFAVLTPFILALEG
jgi:hypothetical protein